MRLLFLLAALLSPAAGQRVVAVGDIHGDYGRFTAVLRATGLIDARDRWCGGAATLVQTGDMLDRGAEARKVIDLLMRLEAEAPRAGGRVAALLGNHEAMNLYGDLRYVASGEFDSFRTPRSAERREQFFARVRAEARRGRAAIDPTDLRAEWEEEHPLGWIERHEAFAADGPYGRWLRRLPAVVKLGGTLFVHGGISAKYLDWSLERINARVREELEDFDQLEDGIVTDRSGPLWFGGVLMDGAAVAARFGVRRVVAGHTTFRAGVTLRGGGTVVLIDTGLAAAYGGRACALILEGDKLTALDDAGAPCVAPLR